MSSETKATHTPGHWSVPHFCDDASGCGCTYVLCEAYAGAICSVGVNNGKGIGSGGNDCPPVDEAKANAHLIAAAPELLDAVCALLAGCDEHSQAQARAAIAKAEGR